MILAGDIGGTKTVLSLLERDHNGSLTCIREQSLASQQFAKFDELLTLFLDGIRSVQSACFGIAGPVVNQRCQTTNLPWLIDAEDLKRLLNTPRVRLLNDLEAMALGMLYLPDQDLLELNPDACPKSGGNMAVIAAGTGLGEAILVWDGVKYSPMATEGGHADFASQNEEQDRLLQFLRTRYPDHVSYERIVSGLGFSNLYDFLCDQAKQSPSPMVPAPNSGMDRNAAISRLGVAEEDPLCTRTIQLFCEIYGAEAGNLALRALATGGIYIGGGIAPKIVSVLQQGGFIKAFKAKGRFKNLLHTLPVKICLNPRTPLIGAINYFDL